jgi:cell division transport system permease protein
MTALREALSAFRRAPVLTGLSAAMIALSLFVIGLFGLAAHNVRQVVHGVESRVEIVAYLRDDAGAAAVDEARREMGGFPEVSGVRYVSRDQALHRARRELPELGSMFGTLETNPLPASLEISLHTGQSGAERVRQIARRVEEYPIVEEVGYGAEWLDKVYLLRRIAGAATMTLGLGFAAVAILIIGAAVRMAIFARRDEIVIMRLVGATDEYIRRPFIIEGMITGLVGAVLALGATWGVYRILSDAIFQIEWLPDGWLVAGLAAGCLVGVAASMVAVRRHLREIT